MDHISSSTLWAHVLLNRPLDRAATDHLKICDGCRERLRRAISDRNIAMEAWRDRVARGDPYRGSDLEDPEDN